MLRRTLLGGAGLTVTLIGSSLRNAPAIVWLAVVEFAIAALVCMAANINLINSLKPGQAVNLQAYVLVTNTNPDYATNADRWNCTNPNPAYHWTNDAERYCFADFQRIVQALQNDPNVVVTDPQGVSVAWGLTPPTR